MSTFTKSTPIESLRCDWSKGIRFGAASLFHSLTWPNLNNFLIYSLIPFYWALNRTKSVRRVAKTTARLWKGAKSEYSGRFCNHTLNNNCWMVYCLRSKWFFSPTHTFCHVKFWPLFHFFDQYTLFLWLNLFLLVNTVNSLISTSRGLICYRLIGYAEKRD